jgi:hypothetical protein
VPDAEDRGVGLVGQRLELFELRPDVGVVVLLPLQRANPKILGEVMPRG